MEKNTELVKQECLYVHMLGGFSLSYHEKPLSLVCNVNNKSVQLLSILLYYGDKGISRNKLLDILYGREELSNPTNSLRAVIFRLRKLLADSGLPQDEYIHYQNGSYFWSPDSFDTVVDAIEFEKMAVRALNADKEQLSLLKQACKLYSGEFLPLMAAEDWVAVVSVRCQELYFSCLREACSQMKEQSAYEEMLELCTAATEMYPFEEWQILQIDCLMSLNRYKEALTVYENATSLFFKELGLPPSEKMLARFREMSVHIHYAAGAIAEVKDSLKEKESITGAYYCNYPSFIDTYRLIVRMIERTGQSVYLLLCTLTDGKDIPLDKEDERLPLAVGQLYGAIGRSLRRGDLYTRNSPNQFLILLAGFYVEACTIVTDRIDCQFEESYGSKKVKLRYYITSAADIEAQEGQRDFSKLNTGWR